ncbi:hypothetical protein K2173_015487 [Erythroxylum novogranatense]|uniref:Uncharacterized protein n=1 Tax=Erythroxylum novogranatense TaxID=1862640 RepID=A0AAV8SRV1_9ROSI|nr:hypothetical protein K2173_015487 [Erythroxylum novogranatense]
MVEKKLVIGLSWEPKLIPGLPSLKSSNISKSQVIDKVETGLFIPPNDPTKLNRLLRNSQKDFCILWLNRVEMPAPTMTPELKRDLQLCKKCNRPKRHYKKGDSKSKRKTTLADELLSDPTLKTYRLRNQQWMKGARL